MSEQGSSYLLIFKYKEKGDNNLQDKVLYQKQCRLQHTNYGLYALNIIQNKKEKGILEQEDLFEHQKLHLLSLSRAVVHVCMTEITCSFFTALYDLIILTQINPNYLK